VTVKYSVTATLVRLLINNRSSTVRVWAADTRIYTRTRSTKWKTCLNCRWTRMKSLRPAMTQCRSWSACECSRLDVPPELIHSSDSINQALKPQLRHRGSWIHRRHLRIIGEAYISLKTDTVAWSLQLQSHVHEMSTDDKSNPQKAKELFSSSSFDKKLHPSISIRLLTSDKTHQIQYENRGVS